MSRPPSIPRHFAYIDGMRGIAAIFVVIFHSTRFHMPQAGVEIPVSVADMPYSAVLWPAYTYGENAVPLFWVISGFVFGHVYWHRQTSARDFALARFARLYPLHFATLVFVAIVQFISWQTQGHWQITGNNDLKHFVLNVFLVGSSLGLDDGASFNAPIWSVSVEILIYVAFFLTLAKTRNSPLSFSLLLAALSFLALNFRPDVFFIDERVFICGLFFFAGSSCHAGIRLLNGAGPAFFAVIAALCGIAIAGAVTGFSILGILAGCCAIVLGLAALDMRRTATGGMLRFLGDISYGLYLVHMPLQMVTLLAIDLIIGGGRGFAMSYATLPVFLAASIAFAYVTYRSFERPMNVLLRDRLASKRHYPSAP